MLNKRRAAKRARVNAKLELIDRVNGETDVYWQGYEACDCDCPCCWDPTLVVGPDRVLVYSRDGRWGVALRLGAPALPIPPTMRFRLADAIDL